MMPLNPQRNRPTAAALYVVGGMAIVGWVDNLVPLLAGEGSLWQFHTLRAILALCTLVAVAALGWARIMPRRWRAVAGRSVFLAGSMLIYFGCLAFLPIAQVAAGIFTAPIFILLIQMAQGMRVGPFRWGAMALGFLGTLLVIQPDPAALELVSFLPILAGLLYAIAAILTRRWCEGESTLALLAGFFVCIGLMAAVGLLALTLWGGTAPLGADGFVLRGWVPLSPRLIGLIALQAGGSMIGIALIIKGYQTGEASQVAVFEYTLLIFASFWAWVMFDQVISGIGFLGMALIIVAGMVIALRSTESS